MMKEPSEFQLDQLMHLYDANYAREYYLRNRKLKGRKPGAQEVTSKRGSTGKDPRTGKSMKQIQKDARAKQRKELGQSIQKMEDRLQKLEALIKKRISEEKSEDRKGAAKKERAAKEADKPKSAAEKAETARENEKYRDKNQQKLKSNAKKDSSGGGSKKGSENDKDTSEKSKGKGSSVSSLKSLAAKVRGQISVAKQKLATL